MSALPCPDARVWSAAPRTGLRRLVLAVLLAVSVAVPVTVVSTAPSATAAGPVVSADRSKKPRASRSAARLPTAAMMGRRVLTVGRRYLGVRYVAGGTSPRTGFDCSGFTRYVYAKAGRHLPRVSRDQARRADRIPRSKAVPGDLVFFHSRSGRIYHVGIYAGGKRVLHSPYPGKRVKFERIWSKRVSYGRAF